MTSPSARFAALIVTPLSLVALAGLVLPGPAFAQKGPTDGGNAAREEPRVTAPNSRMPIRGITLYRSGVGFFERRAMVEGDERIQLRFATDQINDILKSMYILDLGGGRIDGISY